MALQPTTNDFGHGARRRLATSVGLLVHLPATLVQFEELGIAFVGRICIFVKTCL